jgi:hypothetical protein
LISDLRRNLQESASNVKIVFFDISKKLESIEDLTLEEAELVLSKSKLAKKFRKLSHKVLILFCT